ELELRLAEFRRVPPDDDVAHHGELAAPAQGIARDRADDGLADRLYPLPVARDVLALVYVHVAPVPHGAYVGARGEGLVAAGDDHRADALVRVESGERVAELVHQGVVERVQLLGAVEADQTDASARLDEDHFVDHANSGSYSKVIFGSRITRPPRSISFRIHRSSLPAEPGAASSPR